MEQGQQGDGVVVVIKGGVVVALAETMTVCARVIGSTMAKTIPASRHPATKSLSASI
jgi:hypothetical protein